MIKSTILCFNIVSEWKFVIKNEMSYPFRSISHHNRNAEEQTSTDLDRFSPQDHETLRSLHHKPRKLVTQNPLNLIRLLDLDADPDRVHRGLDKHPFVFVPGDCKGVEEDFF